MRGFSGEGKNETGGKIIGMIRRFLDGPASKNTLIILCAGVILFFLYGLINYTQQYNVRVGAVSQQTIKASKNVVDEITSNKKRDEAAAAVAPSYEPREGATEDSLRLLSEVFSALEKIREYGETLLQEDSDREFTEVDLGYASSLLGDFELTQDQLQIVMRSDKESFDRMIASVSAITENELQNATVYEEKEDQTIQSIRQTINRQIGTYQVEAKLKNHIVPAVLKYCVCPNMLIDRERTAQKRQEAREAVEPIYFYQGENIVVEGERVSENQMEALRSLGLLENNQSDYSVYGGSAILILLSLAVFLINCRVFKPEILDDVKKTLVMTLTIVLSVGFSLACMVLFNVYAAPVVFGSMLAVGLFSSAAGFTLVIPIAMLVSGLAAGNASFADTEMISLLLSGLISGSISVFFLKGRPLRIRMLLSGLLAALLNALTVLAISVMTSNNEVKLWQNVAWSAGGGILSAALSVSIQPLFEAVFNISTPGKLLEISNPNQPLLRRLLLEAPGTYHHSIIVANLAEAAAEKIGADPLLARAGAYFHDIGKLKRPLFFKENQMGENPHDHTDPYASAAIVTSHTKDGQLLAQKYKLPREIQQIIIEHHGDTPVMYFYHKALQMANGNPVDINDFRYSGNPPTTKEAAIIMLADTIEAAVRSMPDPTPQQIERFIEKLVRGKLEDGQLSDSPLTLKNIDGICEAFSSVLNGVFHERIEYPQNRPVHRSFSERMERERKEKTAAQPDTPAEAAAESNVREAAENAPKDAGTETNASVAAEKKAEKAADSERMAEPERPAREIPSEPKQKDNPEAEQHDTEMA